MSDSKDKISLINNTRDTLEKLTQLRDIIDEEGLFQKIQRDIVISKDIITKTFSHIFKNTNHYHITVELNLELFLKKRNNDDPINWRGLELIKNVHVEDFFIKNTFYDTIIFFNRNSLIKRKLDTLNNVLSSISNVGIPLRYMIYSNKNKCLCLCFDIYQSAFFSGLIYDINDIKQKNEFNDCKEDYYIEISSQKDMEKVFKIMDLVIRYNGFVFFPCECISEEICYG